MDDNQMYAVACTCGKRTDPLRRNYERYLQEELEKNEYLQGLISRGLSVEQIFDLLIEREYITPQQRDDFVRRYQKKQPLPQTDLANMLIGLSLDIEDAVDQYLDKGVLLEEIPELLVQEGDVSQETIDGIIDSHMNKEVLNRLLTLFGPETALDKIGLDRYCCRRTMLTPAKFARGTGLQIGNSIRTLAEQEKIRLGAPLRAVQGSQGGTPQRPTQTLGRISRSIVPQRSNIIQSTSGGTPGTGVTGQTISATPIGNVERAPNLGPAINPTMNTPMLRPTLRPTIQPITNRAATGPTIQSVMGQQQMIGGRSTGQTIQRR